MVPHINLNAKNWFSGYSATATWANMGQESKESKEERQSAHVDVHSCFTNYATVTSRAFATSLILECVGTLIFTFLGSAVSDKILGPFVNGLALTVVIYMAANISGGHINPAVTFSTLICGFYPLLHSILYIILQIVGAILGALLVVALTPSDVKVGMGDGGPGCFDTKTASTDISRAQVFGWEVIMTFTLISVVYACGIAKPGHGSMTPIAVGFSLMACAGAGAKYTGAALNPARVLGPLVVFRCGKDLAWVYILAELLAAVLACSIFAVVSGWGPLFPYKSVTEFNMTSAEALKMFLTGVPPRRFRHSSADNVNDLQGLLGQGLSNLEKSMGKSGKGNGTPISKACPADLAAMHDTPRHASKLPV